MNKKDKDVLMIAQDILIGIILDLRKDKNNCYIAASTVLAIIKNVLINNGSKDVYAKRDSECFFKPEIFDLVRPKSELLEEKIKKGIMEDKINNIFSLEDSVAEFYNDLNKETLN